MTCGGVNSSHRDDVKYTATNVRRFGLTDNKPISTQKFVQLARAGVVGAVETDVEVTDDVDWIAVTRDPVEGLNRSSKNADVTYSEPGR